MPVPRPSRSCPVPPSAPGARPHRAARPLFALVLLAGLGACRPPGDDDGEARAAERGGLRERAATRVVTEPVEQREMRRLLETTSVVESEHEIDVIPLLAGQVVEVAVEENDAVEAGELLARLDDSVERLALRESEIALEEAEQAVTTSRLAVEEAKSRIAAGERAFEQAERDYQRDVKLRTGGENPYGSVSERTVEASRLTRDQAEQDLAQFRLSLERAMADARSAEIAVERARVARDQAAMTVERMAIRAPIHGQIAERLVRVGDLVTTTAPVFRITDVEELRTVFFRPQRELAEFRADEGRPLELSARAEAVPGARFTGRIERVSPTIDSASGSFRLTAALDRVPVEGDPSQALAPGMLVRIEIVTDRRPDALTVPKRAVRREGEQAYVHRVEGGVARRVEVVEGYTDDAYVQVIPTGEAGLAPGDRVVVVGGRDLEDGAPVVDDALAADGDGDGDVSAAADGDTAAADGRRRDAEGERP